mmetsp:Transcript_45182/g.96067  ORF Transcript_45182/g.96067 Transcript_45182/m.96067 type:complete len:131 (-) Transcript_45182:204-596(-)
MRLSSGKKRHASALKPLVAQAPAPVLLALANLGSDFAAADVAEPDAAEDAVLDDLMGGADLVSTPPKAVADAPAAVHMPAAAVLISSTTLQDDPAGGHFFNDKVGKTPEAASGGRRLSLSGAMSARCLRR